MRFLLVCCLLGSFLSTSAQHSFVRTTHSLSSLAYGLGTDRLGGARMGYLDSNVILRKVDSNGALYKVQLSAHHSAWISRADVADTAYQPRPFYLTGSWSVKGGDNGYDTLSMSLDERLPYKSWMELHPSRIIVELYGVQSNTNWLTSFTTLKEISNVWFEQREDDVVRVTVELKHQQHWGYSLGYNDKKTLQLRVRHRPPVLQLPRLTIALDAGHGGTNTGASGATGALEKEYTLKITRAIEKELKKRKVKVIMTRNADTTIANTDRILALQQAKPDLMISIHLNSSGNREVRGTSTYYKHIGFRSLSTAILNRVLSLKLKEFGNVGHFNFALNAPTDFPNTLLEVLFLSNAEDEKLILDPRFHTRLARQVVAGLEDFLRNAR